MKKLLSMILALNVTVGCFSTPRHMVKPIALRALFSTNSHKTAQTPQTNLSPQAANGIASLILSASAWMISSGPVPAKTSNFPAPYVSIPGRGLPSRDTKKSDDPCVHY